MLPTVKLIQEYPTIQTLSAHPTAQTNMQFTVKMSIQTLQIFPRNRTICPRKVWSISYAWFMFEFNRLLKDKNSHLWVILLFTIDDRGVIKRTTWDNTTTREIGLLCSQSMVWDYAEGRPNMWLCFRARSKNAIMFAILESKKNRMKWMF